MNVQKLVCAFAAAAITTAALGVTLSPAAFGKTPIEVTGEKLDERTRIVSYADLNLASEAGERTLDRRVRGAVRYVCSDLKAAHVWHRYQACRTFAWRGATPQMEQAISRARDIAANGRSDIPPVTLAIAVPR